MKNKSITPRDRNWFLVFIAALLIILGAALVLIAATNIDSLGWWALLIGLSGLATIAAAVTSIVKNDPSLILLSLILPG